MECLSKILPVYTQPDTKLSFHLNTILSKERYPWFYERFTNIKIIGTNEVLIDFVDNIIDDSYRPLFSERVCYDYNMLSEDELVDILKEKLNGDFYSYLWLDKIEIPDTDEYHNYHFNHPVMVYGYDEEEKVFHIINFTGSKGVFFQKIQYASLVAAYKEMIKNQSLINPISSDTIVLTSYKVNKNAGKYQFNLANYLIQLSDYIFSRADNIGGECNRSYIETTYGLCVYEKLIYICDNIADGARIAFKSLFDLNIHKKYMYDRLCYIRNEYDVSKGFADYVDSFQRVVQIFNTIQLLNMKYQAIKLRSCSSFCTEPVFINKMKTLLLEAQKLEKEILLPIYVELSHGVNAKCSPMQYSLISYSEIYDKNTNPTIVTLISDGNQYAQRIEIIDESENNQNKSIGIMRINGGDELFMDSNAVLGNSKRVINFIPCKIYKCEYTEVMSSTEKINTLKFNIVGLNESILWDFKKNIQYDWYTEKHITDVYFNNYTAYIINGNDVNLSRNNINLAANKASYIHIKYCNTTNSRVAQLFFNTYDDTGLSEIKSKIISTCTSNEWIESVFDMSDNPYWKGIIKDLRFDPTGYDNLTENGEFKLEYIKINNIAPVYDSVKQFCPAQGVNGWFYYVYDNGTTYREMVYNIDKKSYVYENCPELYINQTEQNSCKHTVVVRRFVCPADGIYQVSYTVECITSNNKSFLTIRRNHKVVNIIKIRNELNDTFILDLERGENINFEYYNEDENTTESVKLSINIEKQ